MVKIKGKAIIVLIILFAVLIISETFSQNEKKDETRRADWKKLIYSDIEKERTSTRQIVLDQYNDTIDYLISVVNREVEEGEPFYTDNTSRNIAIYLLGKIRAKEAVRVLITWLTPKTGQTAFIDGETLFSPAGDALIEIGLPSVPPLVDLLKTSQNIFSREKYIKIIVAIKGIPETEFLFNNILAKETNPEKRENIKVALELLKDPKYQSIFENAAKRSDNPE